MLTTVAPMLTAEAGVMNTSLSTASESSYSTRICRRCALPMEPADGRRGRRTWRCLSCGRTER